MQVTHEMILLSMTRLENRHAIADLEVAAGKDREAKLRTELDAAKTAAKDMDAEIARLRAELAAAIPRRDDGAPGTYGERVALDGDETLAGPLTLTSAEA